MRGKRIVMVSSGSRGDVQPYLALARGLNEQGMDVILATHTAFAAAVRSESVPFRPLAGDPHAMLDSEIGKRWMRTGSNSFAFLLNFVRLTRPLLLDLFRSVQSATEDADLIVFSPFTGGALDIGEARGVPTMLAALQPFDATREFPAMGAVGTLGIPWLNWMSHRVAQSLLWLPFRDLHNQWRKVDLGLAPRGWRGPFHRMEKEQIPTLYGYSSALIPRPEDWARWLHVTGYWFLDAPTWSPPADLVRFIDAGPRPVYVGFGSMRTGEARPLVSLVRQLAQSTGLRIVLQRGWEGLEPGSPHENIHIIGPVPHSWLFPRMTAVVHHGGAGTTAAGLKAGLPTVVVPHFADQFFWAGWVRRAGAGPAPIPRSRLSRDRLRSGIEESLAKVEIRARAASLARIISAENGIERAREVISEILATAG